MNTKVAVPDLLDLGAWMLMALAVGGVGLLASFLLSAAITMVVGA